MAVSENSQCLHLVCLLNEVLKQNRSGLLILRQSKFFCNVLLCFLNFAFPSNRSKNERNDLASPPGFNLNIGYMHSEASREVDANLIVKRSWDIALAPLKQIPMNLFIMYMAGNSISIFPIMMVGMLFLGPIKALFNFSKSKSNNIRL